MLKSQLITGVVMIVLGVFLIGLSFFTMFVTMIYGLPIFIIGVVILLNKKEDEIEQIKKSGGKK